MAKRRKKGGRRRRKISIFAATGFIVGLKALWDARGGGMNQMFLRLTGYDMAAKSFDIKRASAGIAFFGGAAASMVAAKTGVNRYLNIPWFKL